MSKSHVSLEQKMCVVTGKPYDTNGILLDTTLKESLEKHTITGWGLSPEVQEKVDDGYVALVEIDYEKSTKVSDEDTILPAEAYRLGRVCYLKRNVMLQIIPDFGDRNVSWAEPQFIDYLEELMNEVEK